MDIRNFGLLFDPFKHLDSTKDAHLYEYLVIPKTVEVAWEDAPMAIFARPGGGKSALRQYTENSLRKTRGVKLPVTYVPSSYRAGTEFHEIGLKQALAKAIFIYLISYPDLFLQFSRDKQIKTIEILAYLPFELDFLLDILQRATTIIEIEQLLGVGALSYIEEPGQAHKQMITIIQESHIEPSKTNALLLFKQAREIFEIKNFHVLIDGLDGFIETSANSGLMNWVLPILQQSSDWAKHEIYLKFFLPFTLTDLSKFIPIPGLSTAALEWDTGLLADVIRRRLYVASNGAFDSLDALSIPGLRNVELQVARQLDEKLPRAMIKKVRLLLEKASQNADGYINDMVLVEEKNNVQFA
jgi:hypothetical protein